MIRLVRLVTLCTMLTMWQDVIYAQEGPARAARDRAAERDVARKNAEREAKSRSAAEGTKRAADASFNTKPVNSLSATQLKQAIEAARPAARAGATQMRDVSAGANVAPKPTPRTGSSGSGGQARGRTPR